MMKITDFFSKKKRIFISYRQETSLDFVNHFADRLDDKFEVYYDQKHSEAELVSETIMQEIDQCTHFILVVDKKTFTFDFENENENDNRLNAEDGEIYDYVLAEIRYVREKNEQKKKNKEDEIKIITLCVPGSEEAIEKFKREKKENKDENKNEIKTIIKDLLGINRHTYSKNETFDDFFKKFLEQKMGYDFAVERWKKILKISLLAIFTIALLVFGGTILQKYITSKASKTSEPVKLVFAGGGSVANMIKEITCDSVDVERYENAFYLNMPSENAWILMSEEVMSSHTSDSVQNKFYPVCLSALKAKEKDFLTTVKEKDFINEGTIISYKLPYEDTLLVYIDTIHEKKLYNHLQSKDRIIPLDKLNSEIIEWCNEDSFKIYITRERSGTYHIYKKIFPELFKLFNDLVFRKKHITYYDKKLTKATLENEGNKYIVLSSKYYTPEKIRELDSSMIVSAGDTLSKPMYLYFAGSKYISDNRNDVRLTIPDVMVAFFKRIAPEKAIDTVMLRNGKWKVITPIDSLKKLK